MHGEQAAAQCCRPLRNAPTVKGMDVEASSAHETVSSRTLHQSNLVSSEDACMQPRHINSADSMLCWQHCT